MFAERGHRFGFTASDLQEALDDSSQGKVKRIVEYIKAGAPELPLPGPSYDASSILSFGQSMQGELPQAEPGEVVIWYGGWSFQELRDNPLVRKREIISYQDWCDQCDWSNESLPVGFYALRIPVPNSDEKECGKQTDLLTGGEQVAHPVLVVTAELCHYLQTGKRLLEKIMVRTSESQDDSDVVSLGWHEGRLRFVNYWDEVRMRSLLLASARSLNVKI